jgi:hypothetical protein
MSIKINFINFNFIDNRLLYTSPNRLNEGTELFFDNKIDDIYLNIIFEKDPTITYNNKYHVLYDNDNIKDKLNEINNKIDKYWYNCSGNGPIELYYFKNLYENFSKSLLKKKIAIYISGGCTYYDIVFNHNINFYKELENQGYELDFFINLDNKYYIKPIDESLFGKTIDEHLITKADIKHPYIVFKSENLRNFLLNHEYFKTKIKHLQIQDANDEFWNYINSIRHLHCDGLNYLIYLKKQDCVSKIREREILTNEKYIFYIYHRPDTEFTIRKKEYLSIYLDKLNSIKPCAVTCSFKKFNGNYEYFSYPSFYIYNTFEYVLLELINGLSWDESRELYYSIVCLNCNIKYKEREILNKCKVCSSGNLITKGPNAIINPWLEPYIKEKFDQYNIQYLCMSDLIMSAQVRRKYDNNRS